MKRKQLVTIALLLFCLAGVGDAIGQNRTPPQIIAEWNGIPNSYGAGTNLIIPDQTGNGYGEFIMSHTKPRDDNPDRRTSQLIFAFGDNSYYLNREENLILAYGNATPTSAMQYIGRFLPNRFDFCIVNYQEQRDNSNFVSTILYELGDSIGTSGTLLRVGDVNRNDAYSPISNHGNKPGDLNGNGFKDIILFDRLTMTLHIFFGGDSIKREPDVVLDINSPSSMIGISTGYDLNGDGYDDLLAYSYHHNEGGYMYNIFLGGDPMETEPVLTLDGLHYWDEEERRYMASLVTHSVTLLPDLNGDGYDDWGLFGYHNNGDSYLHSFYYIYYGGEDLSDIPSLELENARYSGQTGSLIGGDFNGDGYGDVLLINSEYTRSEGGEYRIHFGSRWGLSPRYDIRVNSGQYYGMEYRGLDNSAVNIGKFNRDDADDISLMNGDYNRIVILGGNPDWAVNVAEHDTTFSEPLVIEAFPNPFNDVLNVRVKTPYVQQIRIQIYDIQGRVVHSFPSVAVSSEKVWTWNYSASGVYFVKINSQHQSATVKVVCIR